jgi:hypothetical protein
MSRCWLSGGKFNGGVDDTSASTSAHHYVTIKHDNRAAHEDGQSHQYLVRGNPPPRKPGTYHWGTDVPFDKTLAATSWVYCTMCIRANDDAELRPLDLAQHLFGVHATSVDAFVHLNQENPTHGFELGLMAETIELEQPTRMGERCEDSGPSRQTQPYESRQGKSYHNRTW